MASAAGVRFVDIAGTPLTRRSADDPLSPLSPFASQHGSTAGLIAECRRTSVLPMGQRPKWGEVLVYAVFDEVPVDEGHAHRKLGELESTAICGNDITGSCFYVTGSMASAAGIWAPFGAVFACATLWLFRWVYTEAVTALPFNGGIYNMLLNTIHSKKVAAMVASLTMLSYLATSVVSAVTAGSYLQSIIDSSKTDPLESGCYIMPVGMGLVLFFMVLKLCGISESARVAAGMFVFHLTVMGLLMLVTAISIAWPEGLLPFPQVWSNLQSNWHYTGDGAQWEERIVFGFSNAMLGVSGFESSANFVEEQREGVFAKTLRNMWVAVSILNITLIVECIFATELRVLVQNKDNALGYLALMSGGRWLQVLVSVDAFVVCAAAVLTSFVGIGGLVARMAGDRCAPNAFRDDRVTTITFAIVCISLMCILRGDMTKLSACYSFAFLTVMCLFALSLFVLQAQRPHLPRAIKNNVGIPALAAALVVVALSGSITNESDVLPVFFLYLITLMLLIASFMWRVRVLAILSKCLSLSRCCKPCASRVKNRRRSIQQESRVVYFTKTANLCRLNKALAYIKRNEDADNCKIVHLYEDEDSIPRNLVPFAQLLDIMYPSITIDMAFVRGSYDSNTIAYLSHAWRIPTNLMFMSCPTSTSAGRRLQDFRGVRIIMGHEEETMVDGFPTPMVGMVGIDEENANEGPLLDMLVKKGLARKVADVSQVAALEKERRGSVAGSSEQTIP